MDRTGRRPWSDLPPEILSMIGKRLDARMDVVRFRSVCSSFRSSIPPPHRDVSRFPFLIPHLQSAISSVILFESAVCVLETPDGASDSGAPSPPRSRWLVKLQESSLGDLQLRCLFSQRRIACLPRDFPKVIDSLESRIVEICREYRLEYNTSGIVPGIRKVVVSPDCVWTDIDELGVYSIVEDGRLAYWKYGDENWTYLDDQHGCSYDDIIVYEGKVCVVDWSGAVSLIDSSFRTQKFSPSICSDGGCSSSSSSNCKHLVVLGGDLYVVDRYFSDNQGRYEIDALMDEFPYHPGFNETFNLRVYRLDRRCGKWAEVRSLGNMAFFLSKHCSYAISPHELGGCSGNCIYFTENSDFDVNVFSLEDCSIKWLVFSDFLRSTRGTSDLTQPKSMPSRSEGYVD